MHLLLLLFIVVVDDDDVLIQPGSPVSVVHELISEQSREESGFIPGRGIFQVLISVLITSQVF